MINSKVKAVLFDLDGTLLPMDQDVFVEEYFGRLAKKLVSHGYETQPFIAAMWKGVTAMMQNTGGKTNEAVFWDVFAGIYGEQVKEDIPLFDSFYRTEFQQVQQVCGYTPHAAQLVRLLKDSGVRVVLATNPLFPAVAIESRIRWAGLQPEDFELVTTYENCTHCKPNPVYYTDILERLGLAAEDCVMVGNDVGDDMVTQALGMRVFLLTDCLINKDGKDIDAYPHGGFAALRDYLGV